MLFLKLFLFLLGVGAVWRLTACAYAGRTARWFAVSYSCFFILVIGAVWYYLPRLESLKLFIPLFLILAIMYLPILFCFTRGWKEREEAAQRRKEGLTEPRENAGDGGDGKGDS